MARQLDKLASVVPNRSEFVNLVWEIFALIIRDISIHFTQAYVETYIGFGTDWVVDRVTAIAN